MKDSGKKEKIRKRCIPLTDLQENDIFVICKQMNTYILCIYNTYCIFLLQNMPYMEMSGPAELKGDNNSDLSEESLTGDSGRGGSEEDVRNSGLAHDVSGKII